MESKLRRELIFISYHQQDVEWLKSLEIGLRQLDTIQYWSASQLQAGEDEQAVTDQMLKICYAIIILISSDYLASPKLDFILNAAKTNNAKILWVPVRPSLYDHTALRGIDALSDPMQPLALLSNAEIERQMVQICKRIAEIEKSERHSLQKVKMRFLASRLIAMALSAKFIVMIIAIILPSVVIYYELMLRRRQKLPGCELWQLEERSCDHKVNGYKENCKRLFKCQQLFCAQGNLLSCEQVCLYHETGKGTDINFKQALSCYEDLCKKGNSDSCLQAAIIFSNGSAEFKDINRARNIYIDLCNKDNVIACNNLANLHYKGIAGKQDFQNAATLYDKACGKGYDVACINSKIVQAFKFDHKDKKTLFYNLELDCEKEFSAACNSIGVQQAKGIETLIDNRKARKYFEISCNLDYSIGCLNLGRLLELSNINPIEYYRKSCNLGNVNGCFRLGKALEFGEYGQKNDAEALDSYRKSCQKDDARACFRVGWFLEYGKGGEQKNERDAAQAYQKSCDNGYKLACSKLQNNHLIDYDPSSQNIQTLSAQHPSDASAGAQPREPLARGESSKTEGTSRTQPSEPQVVNGGALFSHHGTESGGGEGDEGGGTFEDGTSDSDPGRCGQSLRPDRLLSAGIKFTIPQISNYSMHRTDILLLSASQTHDLQLGTQKEMSKANSLFNMVNYHTSFGLNNLCGMLSKLRPKIVHFSGHGSAESPLWVDEDDENRYVDYKTWKLIAKLLASFGAQCIIFNTCYSDEIGHSISEEIKNVIAITGEITHRAAIEFSNSFYYALWNGVKISESVNFARQKSARAQRGVKIRLFEKLSD